MWCGDDKRYIMCCKPFSVLHSHMLWHQCPAGAWEITSAKIPPFISKPSKHESFAGLPLNGWRKLPSSALLHENDAVTNRGLLHMLHTEHMCSLTAYPRSNLARVCSVFGHMCSNIEHVCSDIEHMCSDIEHMYICVQHVFWYITHMFRYRTCRTRVFKYRTYVFKYRTHVFRYRIHVFNFSTRVQF